LQSSPQLASGSDHVCGCAPFASRDFSDNNPDVWLGSVPNNPDFSYTSALEKHIDRPYIQHRFKLLLAPSLPSGILTGSTGTILLIGYIGSRYEPTSTAHACTLHFALLE